ncbi:MAG: hypothetical protein N4A63_17785 [Vallitalea sp.]|jgi:flagellar operon protein|nr:hypothetical protein [Vallitalea sp.]
MNINPSMYNVKKNNLAVNDSGVYVNNNINSKLNNFNKVLQDKLEQKNELSFSKHATLRLHSRNIKFSDDQLNRINKGVTKAKKKGIKDSLVVIDNVTLVVNIKNNIVVTAMEKEEQNNQVFTNIDGAVII